MPVTNALPTKIALCRLCPFQHKFTVMSHCNGSESNSSWSTTGRCPTLLHHDLTVSVFVKQCLDLLPFLSYCGRVHLKNPSRLRWIPSRNLCFPHSSTDSAPPKVPTCCCGTAPGNAHIWSTEGPVVLFGGTLSMIGMWDPDLI